VQSVETVLGSNIVDTHPEKNGLKLDQVVDALEITTQPCASSGPPWLIYRRAC
jgi:hypothetical protein